MVDALKTLPDDPAELKALVGLLGNEVKSQALLIEKLKHQLAGHNQHRFGAKSEGLDQLQMIFVEDEAIAVAAAEQAAPTEPTPEPKRQHSRKPLPDHLDRNDTVLSPGEACDHCGGALKTLGEDVTEELEYIPGRFVVNRIIRPRRACTCCEAIVQASLPSRPIEKGRPGPGLLAHVLVSKYADHCVPRRRLPVLRASNYVEDEGGPFGAGDRNSASNHRKLRALRALVVSVAEKAGRDPVRYDLERRTQVNRRCGVEIVWMRSEPRLSGRFGISLSGVPNPGSFGLRHEGGASPDQAFTWNLGTCRCDAKGDVQMGSPRKGQSTDAWHRDGAVRSRVESAVMALDRRGCGIQLWPVVNHQTMGRTA